MQRDEDRNLPNQLRAVNLNESDAQEPRPVIAATEDHPAIYRDGHRLTAKAPAAPREPLSGESTSFAETVMRNMLSNALSNKDPEDDRDNEEVPGLSVEVVEGVLAELASARAALEAKQTRLDVQAKAHHAAANMVMRLQAALDEAKRDNRLLTSLATHRVDCQFVTKFGAECSCGLHAVAARAARSPHGGGVANSTASPPPTEDGPSPQGDKV